LGGLHPLRIEPRKKEEDCDGVRSRLFLVGRRRLYVRRIGDVKGWEADLGRRMRGRCLVFKRIEWTVGGGDGTSAGMERYPFFVVRQRTAGRCTGGGCGSCFV